MYVKSSRSTMTWKENLPHINKYFSFSFFSTSPAIRMHKSVHVWRQRDNKVSTWFPWLHRIERVCELLPLIYRCYTKWNDFRLQTSLICKKKKKTTSCEKWLLEGVLKNSFSKSFSKFTEKYLRDSNTVKSFHAIRLVTFLKKDLLTRVSEQAVCRSSRT